MSLVGTEKTDSADVNVVSLFGQTAENMMGIDPLEKLIEEGLMGEDEAQEMAEQKPLRKMVSLEQFPDQSMFVLEDQLSRLKENLSRIKFYLGDLEDLLPR